MTSTRTSRNCLYKSQSIAKSIHIDQRNLLRFLIIVVITVYLMYKFKSDETINEIIIVATNIKNNFISFQININIATNVRIIS